MSTSNESMSLTNPDLKGVSIIEKLGLVFTGLGLLLLFLASINKVEGGMFLILSLTSITFGISVFALTKYLPQYAGIKNNGIWLKSTTNRGVLAWLLGIVLTGSYVLLYWFPQYLGLGQNGEANSGLVAFFNPLSQFLKGQNANQWFVYGTLYTLFILVFGVKFLLKYRHNRYQIIRTIVVMIAQLFLAYLIPEILEGLNSDKAYFAKDLKYFWPLNYYFFDSWHINNMVEGQNLGLFYLVWGIVGFLVLTPVLTYFWGKRWYCSWVCGCGGLAETAGDDFRHLSSKKLSAWKLERWMIHGVMVFIFIVTAVVLYGYFTNTGEVFGLSIYEYFSKPYGFLIGAMFSGVIGVGFYPLLGSRVWCRFGCPMAGYMGLFQRFKSRFRITTNGGQCISCGNCSTYCEQGIDVRWYAQRGQNIVRSSCVGCGICSAVCPRGVLKLENGPEQDRINESPILVGQKNASLNKNVI